MNNKNRKNLLAAVVAGALVAGLGVYTGSKRPIRAVASVADRAKGLKDRIVPIQGTVEATGETWTGGSGSLIYLPSGMTGIITNAHVCNGLSEHFKTVFSTVDGERTEPLLQVKINSKVDLCLYLSTRLLKHNSFKVKNINTYLFGEELLLIGYPLNGPLAPQLGYYITQADMMIAMPMRDATCDGEIIPSLFGLFCGITQRLNAMTTLTYPGNSGSPVFNANNELIGIANSGSNQTNQGNFISGAVVAEFLKGL